MTDRNAIDLELMTTVHRIEYVPERKLGRVLMPPGCCVDMDGTTSSRRPPHRRNTGRSHGVVQVDGERGEPQRSVGRRL
jgi:hypothetical protein